MTTKLFERAARRPGPELPDGELQLQEPPTLPDSSSSGSSMITYLPMALSSMAMVLVFIRPGGGSGALTYVAVGMMAVSAIGMMVTQLIRSAGDRKRQLRSDRRDYLRYLAQLRKKVRKSVIAQYNAMVWRHPDPHGLWSIASSHRLWERRDADDDFGDVRIGRGSQRLGLTFNPISTKPVEDLEPLCAHALRRFIHAYRTVVDQPIAAYLRGYARVLIRGEDDPVRDLVRSVLAQLVVFHSPEDLRVVVVADAERRADWEFVKWLPHAQHPVDVDGAGPVRLVAPGVGDLEGLLGDEFAGRAPFEATSTDQNEPYVVVLLDMDTIPAASRVAGSGYHNCTVIDIGQAMEWAPGKTTLRLRIDDGRLEMVLADRDRRDTFTALGTPDALGHTAMRTLARVLAPYRLGASTEKNEPLTTDFDLATMLGVRDLHTYDVRQLWAARPGNARLRVPLGMSANGTPVELDIKESAQGGMGPHGMLIGATGSGKSELLRTIVLTMAMTHSSETLNFVLVDFKGGATFLGLDQLPHTSAVITNLADETDLVERMKDALHGELIRRQELLRQAGNYTSVLDYETARANGAPLAPLPTLFVVVDEFSELLSAHRDFMDLFIMIGRLGRSLAVHLLLASQRLDEGRMHSLESHLSYRIALRTFSAMESRGVLGVPDAYQLPGQPGNGFLKTDVASLVRFKAAYVSGPYQQERRKLAQSVVAGQIMPFSADYVAPRATPTPAPAPSPEKQETESLLRVAVGRLAGSGPPAYRVWLPPLGAPPTLDELLPPLSVDAELGFTTVNWPGRGRLTVPVGMVDRPFEQIRKQLTANLSASGGHVGIAGGPQSGKSTLVRSLIMALALTHTPREVQFYCLDFGGGTLSTLTGLPHVGGVTGRLDQERVNRTMGEITSLIARRERQFAEWGIHSMDDFRQRRARGDLADEPLGDVFLVVDGWSTIRQDFMDLVPTFTLIATRGLNYGVHVVIASTRWGEIASGLRDQLGTRFELRLGDSADSLINLRAATTVPKIPGRGLTEGKLHYLTALPRIDGHGDAADLGGAVADAVQRVAQAWPGNRAPVVRMLPLNIDAGDLPGPEGTMRVAIGVEETELQPFWHDFEDDPHLVVIGDAETGKTNLLRHVVDAVIQRYSPSQAKILAVDYRRGLFDSLPDEYRLGYAVSVDVVRQMVDGAARAMRTRLPSADITPVQLRKRDWWSGPELYLVIDDYDMLASNPNTNPFLPLLEFLSQGTELGMHLVVARSANGVGRNGPNDPLLRGLLEANAPMVLLSCPPSEGIVFGSIKPRALPPGRAMHVTRRRTVQIQTPRVPAPQPAGAT